MTLPPVDGLGRLNSRSFWPGGYMSLIAARCACGTHTVALPGPPPRVTICFCEDCQRRTGAPFGMATYYEELDLVLPDLPLRRRDAVSGRWLDDHRCPECGVVLYYRSEWKEGVVGIPLGLIRGYEGQAPDRAVFCRNKPVWVVLPVGIDAYERGSDGPRAGP